MPKNASEHADQKKTQQAGKRSFASDSESTEDSQGNNHDIIQSKARDSQNSANRLRNSLSREKAIEIYMKRPDMMGFKKSRRGTMMGCDVVAIEFSVTPKTIRDIWRGRTWSEATGHPQSDQVTRLGHIPIISYPAINRNQHHTATAPDRPITLSFAPCDHPLVSPSLSTILCVFSPPRPNSYEDRVLALDDQGPPVARHCPPQHLWWHGQS
jgi:hypothetical protein